MSDEPAPEAPKHEPAKAGTPKVVLILLVLNLGVSGFATFKLVTAHAPPAAAAAGGGHEEHGSASPNEVTGPVIAFEPFVVNLDEPGTSRYLKVSLQMKLTGAEVNASVEKSKQLLRDTMLSYLSGLHLKDTLGAEAKDKIRTDLVARIDSVMGSKKVKRMFFQEFVVQ